MSHSPSQVSRRRLISLPALPLFLCYLFPLPRTHAFIYIMHYTHTYMIEFGKKRGLIDDTPFFCFYLIVFPFFPHFFYLFLPFSFCVGVALLSFFPLYRMEGRRKKETKPLTRDRSTSVPNNAVIDGERGGGLHGWLAAV